MSDGRDRLSWRRGDWDVRFVAFVSTAMGLLPVSVFAMSRQSGLGLFVSAVLSGASLAVGFRLVRRWLRVARVPRSDAQQSPERHSG
jgi:hypothetical protein